MLEYNSVNERFKKQYEDALLYGVYRDKKTVDAVWKAINIFEDFTGKKDFTTFNTEQARGFRRMLEKKKNAKGEPLSLSTVRSILANVREFFKWLATHPDCIRKVDGSAVINLRLSDNDDRASRATRESPAPTIQETQQALKAIPFNTDTEKRDRAIIAFTALTGVRDAALISLKMKDIDLDKREVWQDPKHVKTKRRKGITTFFMLFDSLWEEIVVEWIKHARETLSFQDNDPIFPKQEVRSNPETMSFEVVGLSREHWANTSPVRAIFKDAFTKAGLPNYRPHSFRKMLVLWAMENCNQYTFKAISQNIGHEHAMTTYNAYGTLNTTDQRKAIEGIGQGSPLALNDVSIDVLLQEVGRRAQK
ncbi:MAG: tyrosine-type recombinase/integrase [Alphaproteobacteria bacterium]